MNSDLKAQLRELNITAAKVSCPSAQSIPITDLTRSSCHLRQLRPIDQLLLNIRYLATICTDVDTL